ncbi:hypothetical protein QR90_06795 [Deinococcus radiopugnans]|uniref:O-antigen ligase-related domain-containing protein n=1 Tax=Deinococcus radiopugnans TaxID=57497 RepID=A0A0A7KFH7_9DEIO|nr:O-antigen ligase family protein [Deinococcus radiopugnans]AIZ44876.1 hypothetical protein QR90_06795 [Deinococcus radiopugnans]
MLTPLLIALMLGPALSVGPLYAAHGLLYLAATLYLMRSQVITFPPAAKWLVLYVVWQAFTLIWAPDLGDGINDVVITGMMVFAVILVSTLAYGQTQRVVQVILGMIGLELLFSGLQIVTGYRLPWLPVNELLSSTTPAGFFGNPNNLAVGLVAFLPLGLLALRAWPAVAYTAAIVGVVALTGSRGGLLAAVLIVPLTLMVAGRVALRRALLTVVLAAAALGLSSAVFEEVATGAQQAVVAVQNYVTGENVEAGASLDVRRRLIENAWTAFQATNGLGIGAGGNTSVQKNAGAEVSVISLHNYWLEILVEDGVIGALLMTGALLTIVLTLWRRWRLQRDVLALGTLMGFLGFAVACVSASSTTYSLHWWVLLALGVTLSARGQVPTQAYEPVQLWRIPIPPHWRKA